MIDLNEIRKLLRKESSLSRASGTVEGNTIGLNLTPEQKEELDKRIEKYERGEGKLYSWDEIRRRIQLST